MSSKANTVNITINITKEKLGTISPKENEKLLISYESGQDGTEIKTYYTKCKNKVRNQIEEEKRKNEGTPKEGQPIIDKYTKNLILNEASRSLTITNIIKNNEGQYQVEYVNYFNCTNETQPYYDYGRTYDGCYFGNVEYPQGKEYLSIFDSLDCKLSNYLHTSAQLTGIHIVLVLVVLFLSAGLGIFLLLLGFTLFFLLFAIVFKIFYFFMVNILAINILVFVSPNIFPAL